MNLILFEPDELQRTLPESDARVQHVLRVLRRAPGEPFDAGVTDGTPGRARLRYGTPGTVRVEFTALPPLPTRPVTRLLVGCPRPQTARDILRDATTLGATELHFVATGRSDPNYAASTLWSSGDWRRHVLAGAMQAFDPRLPAVSWREPLAGALATLPPGEPLYACDNYEASRPLARVAVAPDAAVTLALGPERGWSAEDRELLRRAGATLVELGPRVLRLETAVVAALTLLTANRHA